MSRAQLAKALLPIDRTESGIIEDVSPVLLKESRVIEVRQVKPQPLKVLSSTEVTEIGMSSADRLTQPENAAEPIEVIALERIIDVRPLQPENVPSPNLDNLSGSVIVTRPLQLPNASSPIAVIEAGRIIDVRPLQPENMLALKLIKLLGTSIDGSSLHP